MQPVKAKQPNPNTQISTKNNNKFYETALQYIDEMGLLKKVPKSTIMLFLDYCKVEKLNPFKNEIYLIPFKDTYQPVTSFNIYLRRMWATNEVEDFAFQTKMINVNAAPNKDNLVCYVRIKRKGMNNPAEVTLYGRECDGRGPIWTAKPRQMLEKTAVVRAIRYFFADVIALPYSKEELEEEATPKQPDQPLQVEELPDLEWE